MKRWLFLVVLLCLPAAARAAVPSWPSLGEQLQAGRVAPTSALAKLIAANQDFSRLRPEEARDKIRIPLWLRVLWRRAHPEMVYSAADPTGGYPLVLKEAYEWMLSHQTLVPGPPDRDAAPEAEEEALSKTAATVGGEKRISGAQTSARSESDIRVNYWDPAKILGASNNLGASGAQAQFYSTDGGVTWGQTTLPLRTGDAFHSDPTVEWTSDGTAWSTTIGIDSNATILQMRSYKSTDNGATWTFDATFSGSQTGADKQLIWVDHSATSPFRDNLYAIWHNGNPAFMSRRTGPSGSWQTPVQVSGGETTGTAIGGDVKTNASGDVFGFWPDTGSRRIFVVKSTNGGVSYGAPVRIATTFDSFDIGVPAMNERRALVYVSGGAYRAADRNLVYAAWTDLTGASGCATAADEPGSNIASTCKTRIWFSRSTDGGSTWSAPAMINNQASLSDQFNQALVVDEKTGAVEIVYYDTAGDPGRKKVDVWQQSSFDGGVTWSAAVKVTSAQTDETSAEAESFNQFGDYNSLSGISGQFFPSWTDRRNDAREEIWTARITEPCLLGPGFAGLASVTNQAAASCGLTLSWTAATPSCGGPVTYNVYRSTTPGFTPAPANRLASGVTGTGYGDTSGSLVSGTTYYYVVRAMDGSIGVEEGNSVQRSAAPTGPGTAACVSPSGIFEDGFESGNLDPWSGVTP